MQTERAVSSQTYWSIPGTSIETRDMQENTSTQADTNELWAPEKKKIKRWSESQTKTLVYLMEGTFSWLTNFKATPNLNQN